MDTLDILITFGIGLVTIGIGYLGIHLAIYPLKPESTRARFYYCTVFILLALTGVGLSFCQTYRNATEQRELRTTIKQIKEDTKQKPRLQAQVVGFRTQGKVNMLTFEVKNGGGADGNVKRGSISMKVDGSQNIKIPDLKATIAPGVSRFFNGFIPDNIYEAIRLGKSKLEVEFTMDYTGSEEEKYWYFYRGQYNAERNVFVILDEKSQQKP